MDIKSLGSLEFDASTGLYNLFAATFNMIPSDEIQLIPFTVDISNEMRIDTICNDIYGSTENVDFLLNLNNILMPLSIKAGDVILYVDSRFIEQYTPLTNESSAPTVRDQLVNTGKQRQVDKNKSSFNDTGTIQNLPPTVSDNAIDPITINGDTIVISNTNV